MNIIQNNPYRVLGVYSNASKREIIGAENKIKAYVKIGRTINFKTDFTSLLGDVERTEESLAGAISNLTLAKDKILYALFWFINENAFDEVAFNHLASGNIDSAVNILSKKTTASSLVNLAACSLVKRQWANALYCYTQLLEDNKYVGFVNAIAGEDTVISKTELASTIVDSLEQFFPEVNWLFFTKVKKINLGTESIDSSIVFSKSLLVQELRNRYVDIIYNKINTQITEADKANRKVTSECLSAAKNLSRLNSEFKALKSIIGESDIRYISLSDKAADLLNSLCIGYYNNSSDYRRARIVFPFVKDALSYACSDNIIKTCQEGVDFISKKVENLPPEEIEKECQDIDNHLSNYVDQGDNSLLLSCIASCQNLLTIIRNKVGENHKEYVNQSSLVVHFAINQVVDEVNEKQKAYNDAPQFQDATELAAYKKSILWAKSVMAKLASFAKDSECQKRYEENNKTLTSLYNRNCIVTPTFTRAADTPRNSYTPRNATRSSRPNNSRTTGSSTNNTADKNGCGCLVGIIGILVVFFIVIFICVSISMNRNPFSSPSRLSEDSVAYDTLTADTVADDSEDSYAPSSYESSQSEDDIWLEQYKGNSLKTGATPYRSVYGGNSKAGNAGLKIKAPATCDVLVIIKRNGDVVKHAYIRCNQTYTFTLRAGTYQPFFVFGNSWCPEKESPNGQLGYFLEDVSISKDYPQEIGEYQELEYTLQTVTNGNFHAESSDESEAF